MKTAILCPGPTLKETLPSTWDEYDFVVAVTDAIFAHAPISHWSYTENPTADKREVYREKLVQIRPTIWGLRTFDARWRVNMRMRNYTRFDLANHDEVLDALPYRTKIEDWTHGPTHHAIARCLAHGASAIHLFGCDLSGEFNVHPVTGSRLGSVGKSPQIRWSEETDLLERIEKEADAHGVEIRRVHPPLEHHLGGTVDDAGEAGGHARGRDHDRGEPSHLDPQPAEG